MSNITKAAPARHTPGPWRIAGPSQEPNGIQSISILAGEGPTRWGVAKLSIVDTLRDAAVQSANARLIESAPELYQGACKAILQLSYAAEKAAAEGNELALRGIAEAKRILIAATNKVDGRP